MLKKQKTKKKIKQVAGRALQQIVLGGINFLKHNEALFKVIFLGSA